MATLPSRSGAKAAPAENKKRKADDDKEFGGPSKQPTPSDREASYKKKRKATEVAYRKYREAYEGKSDHRLGSDTPKHRNLIHATTPFRCVLILSTKDQSELLTDCETDGAMRAKYDISSQNPLLEIKLGISSDVPFVGSHSLFIGSEHISGEVKRCAIRNPTADMFREAVTNLGLPPISHGDERLESVIDTIKNTDQENGINFLRLAIRWPLPAPRPRPDYTGSQSSPLVKKLDGAEPMVYLTIARMSTDHIGFADGHWDYLIHRCQKDGIYWGYKLDRQIPGSSQSYPELVIQGDEDAPYLPWMKDKKGFLGPQKMRPWFTSPDEFEAFYTVALLQDTAFQRARLGKYFAMGRDAPVHELTVKADNSNLFHFTLQIKASVPARATFPAFSPAAKFKIQYAEDTDECFPELEARLVSDPENQTVGTDFLLGITFSDGNIPWGPVFSDGCIIKVKISVEFNETAARRQLLAIQEFRKNGKMEVDVFPGNPPTWPNRENNRSWQQQIDAKRGANLQDVALMDEVSGMGIIDDGGEKEEVPDNMDMTITF